MLGLLACEDHCDDICGCEPRILSYYSITNIDLTLLDATRNILQMERYYDYADIQLELLVTETRLDSTKTFGLLEKEYSFFSTAYACSYVPHPYNQNITSIKIIAKNDFIYQTEKGLVESNQNINEYFFISGSYSGSYDINNLSEQGILMFSESNLRLLLLEEPTESEVTMVFDIIITLDDGQVFTFENQELKVK